MSGMPDQNNGLNHDATSNFPPEQLAHQSGANSDLPAGMDVLSYNLMANPQKRSSDSEMSDQNSESSKRARMDMSDSFPEQNMNAMAPGPNAMDSLLSAHIMGHPQQPPVAGNMNPSVERMAAEEANCNQEQSPTLPGGMAMMCQPTGVNNGQGIDNTFLGMQAVAPQRQHSNPGIFSQGLSQNANLPSLNQMQTFQGFQGMPSSGISQQQLRSGGTLDYSNLRLAQQAFGGGLLPQTTPSMFQPSFNQMPMQPTSNPAMGQWQTGFPAAGASSAVGGQAAGNQVANPAQAFNMDMLQLARMGGSQPHAALQQAMVPQQPQSLGLMSDMMLSQPTQRLPTPQRQEPLIEVSTSSSSVLPPLEDTSTPHFSQRPYFPFAVDEDANWLSEFQCFIRSEILELFRVSQQGIKVRNAVKSLTLNQVGIRCRFCAHLQHGTRANRASCFPSKIDKIYQSFTMMLREHFPHCPEIPEDIKAKFTRLQGMNAQGASNAKGYWEHAAKKKGLVDIGDDHGGNKGGIHIFERTLLQASMIPPFGSNDFSEPRPPETLVMKSDQGLVSDFLYALMEQVYRVHLAPSEKKGNRKSLPHGMPGFGCRYCYDAGRMGLCRLFPARRRTIHTKIPDLFDHMKRCPLCPQPVKDHLILLHKQENTSGNTDQESATRGREREFYERIWTRLGHQDNSE